MAVAQFGYASSSVWRGWSEGIGVSSGRCDVQLLVSECLGNYGRYRTVRGGTCKVMLQPVFTPLLVLIGFISGIGNVLRQGVGCHDESSEPLSRSPLVSRASVQCHLCMRRQSLWAVIASKL